jgi:hypothetical protein
MLQWRLSADPVGTSGPPGEVGEVDVLMITDSDPAGAVEPPNERALDAVRRAVTSWASAAVAVEPVTDTLIWVDGDSMRRAGAERGDHRVVRWPAAIAGEVVRQLPVGQLWAAATAGPAQLVAYLTDAGVPVLPVDQ